MNPRSNLAEPKYVRIVTPQQLKAGYTSFHPGQIPNVRHHEFKVIQLLSDGNWIVHDPNQGKEP